MEDGELQPWETIARTNGRVARGLWWGVVHIKHSQKHKDSILLEPQKTSLKLCVTSVTLTHLLMNASFDSCSTWSKCTIRFSNSEWSRNVAYEWTMFYIWACKCKIENVDSLVNPIFTGLGLNLDGLTCLMLSFKIHVFLIYFQCRVR